MTPYTAPAKPVRPRNAASLVIYEKRGSELFVLMGKRAKGHRFLPDVFVFPGGRVDTDDFHLPVQSPLRQEVSDRLSNPGNMAHAIATAAIRETFEETGLIVGDLIKDQLVPDLSNLDYVVRAITPIQSPIRFDTRFLSLDAHHANGNLGGSGELIDLQWFSINAALNMPLVDVTEFVLQEIEQRLTEKNSTSDKIPLFTYLRGKPFIRRG